MTRISSTCAPERIRVSVNGAVQGVGFRPYVWRLATGLGLTGWVRNDAHGVVLEVEGAPNRIDDFLSRLEREQPPPAAIDQTTCVRIAAQGSETFTIETGDLNGAVTARILPDLATCPDCLRELRDPRDRRYRYPFLNCTRCGPRFSVIEGVPYERSRTTMRAFALCQDCRSEYEDPANRRFHAEPTACPACGPRLSLWDADGRTLSRGDAAIEAATAAIREGRIVAVKGIGGFHLMADAGNEDAVARLRLRKRREAKPLALLFPSLEAARVCCLVSAAEEALLVSAAAPIVLLKRLPAADCRVAPAVAKENRWLGVMLPSNPLQHLLMQALNIPVVATSGNLSDEPICIDEQESLQRLRGVADLWLVNDRPIARHADDSVVRVVAGRPLMLRRARGYVPDPVPLDGIPAGTLAVGAHLKSVVALSVGDGAVASQHLGDLESPQAREAFENIIHKLGAFYRIRPSRVVCDAHPDYASTRFAEDFGPPPVRVQHHLAHVLACRADNGLSGAVLGAAWDGSGFGLDGAVWGGEFIRVDGARFERVAHLRPFRLPGGDAAAREPRRSALGLMAEMGWRCHNGSFGNAATRAFQDKDLRVLCRMIERGTAAPRTTSVGRLLDGIAALLDVRQINRYEGEAAMALEHLAEGGGATRGYPVPVVRCGEDHPLAIPPGVVPMVQPKEHYMLDWEPMVRGAIADAHGGVLLAEIAAKVHRGLAAAVVAVARLYGEHRVMLTGGCFQNKLLTEWAIEGLSVAGKEPFWHRRFPPNDGGIALGQLAAAAIPETR